MTKPNSTLIVALLDRSGSMSDLKADTIGGFNTFLAEQKAIPTDEARLTLITFDHDFDVICDNLPLAEAVGLTPDTYVPRGSTALLDAVGRAIDTTGVALAAMPEDQRPSAVVVCIVTDGQDNVSHKYTHAQIAEMIARQEKDYAWSFIFLAANQDAIQTAASMGINAANSLTYTGTGAGTSQVYQTVSQNIGTYRQTRQVGNLGFTGQQRTQNSTKP